MNEPIRVLIVDDEPLARERLRTLLATQPRIEIIGECGDGRQALEKIQAEKPDLVFMDVQMPELDGFQVLAGLDNPPPIIFVTAHDRFALKAFDVHAVDYLLKPFDRARFETALKRALGHLDQNQGTEIKDKLNALLADLKPAAKPSDRLAVKTDGRVLLVKIDDVDWLEADDNYVKVHLGADTHMVRDTLAAMAQKLPPEKFVRVSRGAIVNLDRIKELQPLFHGEYVVILRSGAKVTLTRGYKDNLRFLTGAAS